MFCHLLPYLDMLGLATQSYMYNQTFLYLLKKMGELACKHLKFMEMAKEYESTDYS